MKKLFSILLACATMSTSIAQITAPVIEEKPETDIRYMAGAVPEVNGKVVLTRTVEVPAGLTQQEVMNRVDAWLVRCTKDERMHYNQRLPKAADNELQHSYSMELTFSKSFLAHDFAELAYVLAVRFEGGQLIMEMSHINYKYNENNKLNKYTAEEMIVDKYALNKKKTKLIFGFKKFRMKTIDLLDELQISLQNEFK
ncbi:MAG: DUF4468 domain-containing protein [Bacteroidales bacterium]|nr:DUF4468 domain-containing protein [Bacteroidales bacterium]